MTRTLINSTAARDTKRNVGTTTDRRQSRVSRKPKIALAFLSLIFLATAPQSHAGTGTNGTGTNGTGTNGTGTNGTGTNGTGIMMSGEEFVAVKPASDGSDVQLMRILGFHGDHFDTRLWSPQVGWTARQLHPRDLIGVEWTEQSCDRPTCARRTYRIADANMDTSHNTMPGNRDNRDIWLFDVITTTDRDAPTARWRPACAADASGLARGFFITGDWHRDGAHGSAGYTFSCTSGAIAKCARTWGYKPWKTLLARDGRPVPLRALHHACTRTVRADYCGDGVSHTRDGTLIDIFDRYGFNIRDRRTGFAREAGFSTAGALWVERPRLPESARVSSLRTLFARCVRPRPLLTRASESALLEVWSQLATRAMDARAAQATRSTRADRPPRSDR